MTNKVHAAANLELRKIAAVGLWLGCSLAVATAIRAVLNPLLGATLPFTSFYPATLFVTYFCGWRAGVTALLLSIGIGNYLFVTPAFALTFNITSVAGSLFFAFSDALIILPTALLCEALDKMKVGIDPLAELHIEVKNTLA